MSLLELPFEVDRVALAAWLEVASLPLLPVAAGPELCALAETNEREEQQ